MPSQAAQWTSPDPRTARWLRRLPKAAYSPALKRTFRLSAEEWRLIKLAMEQPGNRHSQAKLAELAGYRSQGAVSKALHRLRQLGLIALLTTRGWAGRTTIWVRAGVRDVANIPPLSTVLNTITEALTVPLNRDGTPDRELAGGMIHTAVGA